MNNKFFQLPPEKQRRIINAAYRIFSKNSYKKAPMSEIAAAGNISKSLLFHYFTNKRELYLFLWNNAIEQIHKASLQYRVTDSTDFFEILRRSLFAKCFVIRNYPYLYQFAINAYYEEEPQIKSDIQKNFSSLAQNSEALLWKFTDSSIFRPDIDLKLMYQEILWTSDGYLRQMIQTNHLDADKMEQDFERLIEQWKKIYLK